MPKTENKRVLCLYRVSTKKQGIDNDIPRQREACQRFIKEKGWKFVGERLELGISGSKVPTFERTVIKEIMDEAHKKDRSFDILLVFMPDRLGRRELEVPYLISLLDKEGVEIWSTTEGRIKVDTAIDSVITNLKYAIAKEESSRISQRTKESHRQIVEAGLYRGGTPPFGYHAVLRGRTNGKPGIYKKEVHDLEILESEAAVVREIFDLSLNHGYGGKRIATTLWEKGITDRSGMIFHSRSIQTILKNNIYQGIICTKKKDGSIAVQSEIIPELQIIPPDVFARTQEQLATRSAKYAESRLAPMHTKGNTLLSGNVFCGHCGSRMSGSTRHRKDDGRSSETIYKCYNSAAHRYCDGPTTYSAARIDKVIDSVVRDFLAKVKKIDPSGYIRRRIVETQRVYSAQLSRDSSAYSKNRVERKDLSALMVASIKGECVFTPEDLKSRMEELDVESRELEERIEKLTVQLAEVKKQEEEISAQWRELNSYADLYDQADMELKRQIVSRVIQKVTVSRGYKIDIGLRIGLDAFQENEDRSDVNDQT